MGVFRRRGVRIAAVLVVAASVAGVAGWQSIADPASSSLSDWLDLPMGCAETELSLTGPTIREPNPVREYLPGETIPAPTTTTTIVAPGFHNPARSPGEAAENIAVSARYQFDGAAALDFSVLEEDGNEAIVVGTLAGARLLVFPARRMPDDTWMWDGAFFEQYDHNGTWLSMWQGGWIMACPRLGLSA